MRVAACAAVGIAAVLGGCSMALDSMGSISGPPPGKYAALNCNDLGTQTRTAAEREAELNALMARSGQDAGGQIVNIVVYQDELAAVRGNLDALRKTTDEKRCAPDLSPKTTALGPMH